MQNITHSIQQGKGSAIHRLTTLARKAEKAGDLIRAEKLRQRADFLKSQVPTISG